MTIYEIDEQILGCLDLETGEVIDLDKLNALEMERKQKIGNVACWIKDLQAEAKAIAKEEAKLKKRKEAAQKKAESLKEWLRFVLNGEKFKDARISIYYKPTKVLNIPEDYDLRLLPSNLVKITKEPRKAEIKKAMEEGQTFEGITIEEKESVVVR